MRNLFAIVLVSMTAFLCSAIGEENISVRLQNAEKGFQDRWQQFQNSIEPFPLWSADWTEADLKSRFDQITSKRWQVYFINPEDLPEGTGHYRAEYEPPASFKSWGSRYSYPGSFRYNSATDFYNASIISLRGKQFLAMEAPTRDNYSAFCQLLKDYQVTDLVRLMPAVAKNRENSFPYWEDHIGVNAHNGRSTVEINGQELNYFFTDRWENREGMEPEKIAALVKAVMKQNDDSQMIAVHCRAGVGRTGAFLAAITLIHDIDSQIAQGVGIDNIQISIDQIIWELSLQRPLMATHFSQYKALYCLVNWYVESIKTAHSGFPTGAFPNYAGKWTMPSLMTPERSLTYHQTHNLLPSCSPPKTIIFCYSKGLMKRVMENYSMRQCDGKLKELYFFVEYPDVAIVYYGQGAPSNAMRLEYLLSWGVKQCISIGLAGGLQKDLSVGDLIVCDKAIRDEGTSHHYLPAEKYAYPSKNFTDTLCQTLDKMKIPYRKGPSWTTDAFYRQTKEEIEQYQKEGVMTVEMEAAALFTITSLHQAEIISFFTISDTIGDLEWKPDFENPKTSEGLDTLVKIALKAASSQQTTPNKSIEIVPYNPEWPQMFEKEAKPIQQALGDNCLTIHHFGSTSVPGLSAKPKIDILAAVKQLGSIDYAALEKLGFESRGEVIPTGRYFCKESPRVHLHIFEERNPLIHRNLIFRDWLRTHEEDREAYAALKMKLADVHNDGMSYCRAKTEFINQIIAKAESSSQSQ
jgi:uridine phosphorylase